MSRQTYTVSLPEWEGPLDLLLHVIRTHELDILDIPIAFVTEQYVAYLDMMRELNLDVAAEYLEMAATLAYIKSRMLLPQEPAEEELPEEEGDPREELVRRLLQYQRYKDAAEQLSGRPMMGRDTFGPPQGLHEPVEPDEGELVELGVFDLLEAFRNVLARTEVDLSHDVTTERISVSERIGELVELLHPGELVPFERLFEGAVSRLNVVVTFLALLEMTKLRMTRMFQAPGGGNIYVALAGPESRRAVERGVGSRGIEDDQWQGATTLRRRGARPRSRTLELLSRRGRERTRREPRTLQRLRRGGARATRPPSRTSSPRRLRRR